MALQAKDLFGQPCDHQGVETTIVVQRGRARVASWDVVMRHGTRRLGKHPAQGPTRSAAVSSVVAAVAASMCVSVDEVTVDQVVAANALARQADELDQQWVALATKLRPRVRGECHPSRTVDIGWRVGVDWLLTDDGSREVKGVASLSPAERAGIRVADRVVAAFDDAGARVGVGEIAAHIATGAAVHLAVERAEGLAFSVRVVPERATELGPCPWVGCRYHTWHARHQQGVSSELQFESLVEQVEPEEWGETCSLDVAEAVDTGAGGTLGASGPGFVMVDGRYEWRRGSSHTHAATGSELDHADVGRRVGVSREQVRLDEHAARRPDVVDALRGFVGVAVTPAMRMRVYQRLVRAWEILDVSREQLAERARVSPARLDKLRQLASLPERGRVASGTARARVKATGHVAVSTLARLTRGGRVYVVISPYSGEHRRGDVVEIEVAALKAGRDGDRLSGDALRWEQPRDDLDDAVVRLLAGGAEDPTSLPSPLTEDELERVGACLGLTLGELIATSRTEVKAADASQAICDGLLRDGLIAAERARLTHIVESELVSASVGDTLLLEPTARRLVDLLLESEAVDEVFGDDEALLAIIRPALSGDIQAQEQQRSLFGGFGGDR